MWTGDILGVEWKGLRKIECELKEQGVKTTYIFKPQSRWLCHLNKTELMWGFPDSSVGKESFCNAEDPHSIPGLGRSPGEGIGYPLQYSWASLVAQLVKNLPTMWATRFQSLRLSIGSNPLNLFVTSTV